MPTSSSRAKSDPQQPATTTTAVPAPAPEAATTNRIALKDAVGAVACSAGAVIAAPLVVVGVAAVLVGAIIKKLSDASGATQAWRDGEVATSLMLESVATSPTTRLAVNLASVVSSGGIALQRRGPDMVLLKVQDLLNNPILMKDRMTSYDILKKHWLAKKSIHGGFGPDSFVTIPWHQLWTTKYAVLTYCWGGRP